ncbi:ZIP family metal transporter [Poritiphilus flavus]|uniref:ZIP family metal transporter n=1 Tax=Poritiphilus flavus TaxID=2697053 RepID=A0A6L9EFA7_9FLAO|nr:ZIP family metal transporter [Poritiphilus flavus]NAS13343.1 ZIP family metal transporter [Poritiphilus flavus]
MTYLLLVLSVLVPFGFVYAFRPEKGEGMRLLLAFSGAYLLALTTFELLPEVYQNSDAKTIGGFIILGIVLQIFLEFFSKGAEHGHVHLDSNNVNFPLLLFVSISLHAFLEGIPLDQHGGILYGILVHKIPIALILSLFLINSKIKRVYVFLFIVLFSLMTPLGYLFAGEYGLIGKYSDWITALVIGVFLHISTIILFESSEGHTFNLRKLLVILLGVLLAYFI